MTMNPLPARISAEEFDALHDQPEAWRPVLEALAQRHGGGPVQLLTSGTVLVARLGDDRVLKLYPPFLQDHCDFEAAMLPRLHGRLSLPTPRLLARDALDGWPMLLMTLLPGEPLTAHWPTMAEPDRLALLHSLGRLSAEVHALPVGDMQRLSPEWRDFIARQRAACVARQQRTGLPPHLLAQVPEFIAGPLPAEVLAEAGHTALLTGEYTPMNLLCQGPQLSGMFDFGDGLVGQRAYDWLGPLCFLAAGHAARCRAFLAGCGVQLTDALRLALLRLLLLHRYSALRAQIACPGWQAQPDLPAVARLIWP